MPGGTILITGGTSGLGKELVKRFLKEGWTVVATGRSETGFPEYGDNFSFFRTDFSDLGETAGIFRNICASYDFDAVINNAGILSPTEFTTTPDCNEYTFQVNYLAHLMINEMIIKNQKEGKHLIICAITSPVYRIAGDWIGYVNDSKNYTATKAYSVSKLLLAVMCRDLPEMHLGLTAISFNPGIFSSGIYRMRGSVFQVLYHVAAPFMKSPARVSKILFNILTDGELHNGSVYRKRGEFSDLPQIVYPGYESLKKICREKTEQFLK